MLLMTLLMTMVMMQLMTMIMMTMRKMLLMMATMLKTMMMMTNYLRMVPPMISVVSRVLAEPTKNDPAVLRRNHPHHDYCDQIIIVIFFS